MAGVSATVNVNDGLTRAFQRMSESIKATNQLLNGTAGAINNLNPGQIIILNNQQQQLNNNLNNGANSARNLVGAIGALVAGYVSLRSAANLVKLSDEYIQTQARLALVNDGLQTQSQLNNKIFNEAQNIGASYKELASTVANLSLRAGDAFASNDQALLFASNLTKLFNIAGTSQQEIASATLQLTQGLGAGVLRGEELNAVFEAAPNIIQQIANYLDVPIGQIRNLASEGQLTADTVRNALISATDDIDKQFNSIPFTSDNFWNRISNSASFAFSQVYQAINNGLNSERAQGFIEGLTNSITTFAGIATVAIQGLSAVLAFLYDYWSLFAPLLTALTVIAVGYGTALLAIGTYTRAAALAQLLFNAALNANPIVRVILLIIAFITIIVTAIQAVNFFGDRTISVWGAIAGGFAVLVAYIANSFLALFNFVLGIVGFFADIFLDLGDFIGNVFNDPLKAAAKLFVDFASRVLDVVGAVAKAIDVVFRTDYSAGFKAKAQNLREFGNERYGGGTRASFATKYQVDGFNYSDAYNYAYDKGSNVNFAIPGLPQGLGDSSDVGNPNFDLANAGAQGVTDSPLLKAAEEGNKSAKDTAKNTKEAAQSTKDLAEDLKYIRELQAQEAVNRYTTASLNIDLRGMQNNLGGTDDIDGFVRQLTDAVEESLLSIGGGA